MDWKKPEVLEVNMSAEIGAYQDDSGDREEPPITVPRDELFDAIPPRSATRAG